MSASQDSATAPSGGRSFPKILSDIRDSTLAFTNPADLIVLLGYSVNLFSAIRISVEAGIFRHLASTSDSLSVAEITAQVDGSNQSVEEREEFLTRMLRSVAALNLVDEVGPARFQANELTRTLAEPGFDAGIRELFDTALGPHSTLHHTTLWARDNGYTAPERSTDGPYQRARGIVGTTSFQHWSREDPQNLSNLSALMKVIQRDRMNWSAWFPVEELFPAEEEDRERVFMVDVGGGLGHDLMGLAGRYPEREVRLVVEDQAEVIAQTRKEELDARIEAVEHDFFQPQPVKGANIYFMHKIMHDWPDAECTQILAHLRDAMALDSRIFINDVILPDQGTPLLYAAFDICMFVQLSAKERSEAMWHRLISKVGGLEVRKFWQAPGMKGEGIVEVVKTSREGGGRP